VAARIAGEFGAAAAERVVGNTRYVLCTYQLKRFRGGSTSDYTRLGIQSGGGVFAVPQADFPGSFTAPGQKFYAELSPHDLPEDAGPVPVFAKVEAAVPRLGRYVLLAVAVAGIVGAVMVFAVVRPTVQDVYRRQQTGIINQGSVELRKAWQDFKRKRGFGDLNDPSSYSFNQPLTPDLTEKFASHVTQTLQAEKRLPSEAACVFLTLLEHQVDLNRNFADYPRVTNPNADNRAIWEAQQEWLADHPEQQIHNWTKLRYEQAIAAQSQGVKKRCLGVSLKPLAP
jgi:hypothetical protein